MRYKSNTQTLNTVNSSHISDQLKQILLEWNDADDKTRAASKARLELLGADGLTELAAATQYVEHRYRVACWFLLGAMVLAFALFIGGALLMPHEPHAPTPAITGWLMFGGFAALVGGFALGEKLFPGKLATGLAQALSCYSGSQSIGLLLRLTSHFSYSSQSTQEARSVSSPHYGILTQALNQVSGADAPVLTEKELRRLRGLASLGYVDISSAALHALTVMNDASILPKVRKLAKRTRNWELQEAANEYLRRFAPEEVSTRHRIPVEPSLSVEGQKAPLAPILASVMRLGSRNPAERHTAENALRAMQPQELTQILLLLDQEPPAMKQVSHAIVATCALTGMLIGSLVYFWALHWPYFDARMAGAMAFGGAIVGAMLGWLTGLDCTRFRRNQRRAQLLGSKGGVFPEKRLLDVLTGLEDVALIGTLLEHIPASSAITGGTLRRALRAALQNLLPRMRASDAHLLSDAHCSLLNHELQRSRFNLSENWTGAKHVEAQAKLDVAILKAWEQVGDEQALGVVQQLAAITSKSPHKKRVQQAAEECLPYLEARVGEQRQTQTLLRAAAMPSEAGDVLLRAVQAHQNVTEPQQLLRGSDKNIP